MPRVKRAIESDDDYKLVPKTENDPEDQLIITGDDLRLLSGYLGRNINSRTDLLQAAQKVSTIKVDGREIVLEPALLQRVKSRCHHSDFPRFLEATIKQQLHSFVGW